MKHNGEGLLAIERHEIPAWIVLTLTFLFLLLASVCARADQIVQRHIKIEPEREAPFKAKIWTKQNAYDEGDSIRVYFQTSRDAYVYIFDTDTQGRTRQLFPNYYDRDAFVRGGDIQSLPNRGYTLAVSGPPGRESLDIVAVSERLGGLRPFERYDEDDPYPLRRQGAKDFLKRLKYEAESWENDQKGLAASSERNGRQGWSLKLGDPRREARAQADIRIEPRPTGEPPQRRVLTARGETGFWVRKSEPLGRRMGRVQVLTRPPSAKVYVDNRYAGLSGRVLRLSYGLHEIRVSQAGYRDEVRTVRVRGSERQKVYIKMRPLHRGQP